MKKAFLLSLACAVSSVQASVSPRLREAIKATNLSLVQEELSKAKLSARELAGLVELANQRIEDLNTTLKQLNAPDVSYQQWGSQGSNTINQVVHHKLRDDIDYIAPYSGWYTTGLGTAGVITGFISFIFLNGALQARKEAIKKSDDTLATGTTIIAALSGAGCLSALALMFAARTFIAKNDAAYRAKIKTKYDEATEIKQILYEYESVR